VVIVPSLKLLTELHPPIDVQHIEFLVRRHP